MIKNPENLDSEFEKLKAGFFGEEKEFIEKYSKSTEKQEDDFGFAKKEKEEKEAAALREKFKEIAENTPEEDKKKLREGLLSEEAERMEKAEKEQIAKEEAIFNKKIREEATILVKSGELDDLNNTEGVRRYLFLRKSGIIKGAEEFSSFRNKNENFKRVLSNSKPENLKILIDRFDIKTMDGLDNVLGLDIDKLNEVSCDLEMIKHENLDYFLDHFKINTPKLFREALKEVNIGLILHHSDPENLKYLIDKFQINKIEQFEAVAKNNNSNFGWQIDGDLLGNAKHGNLKYIVENYQVESVERLYEIWADDDLKAIIKYANLDNLKHIVELYTIKTLEQLKDIAEDVKVSNVVSRAIPENFKTFISLCKNKEEFQRLCDETGIGEFLQIANIENFCIMTSVFSTPEKFIEAYKEKNIKENLMRAKPENLKYIIENCQIDNLVQLKELADSEQVIEVLINADGRNFSEICDLYKIKSIESFEKICKDLSPLEVFQNDHSIVHYLIENKIVNANNLQRLNYQAIGSLGDLVFIKGKHFEKEIALETAFLRKLMNNYPESIANSLISFQYINKHSEEFKDKRIDFSRDEKEIFEALDKLGSITPIIFNKFRDLNPEKRDSFAEKIKQIKKEMFKNKPIETKENNEETAELIYLSYKPIGMDYQKVKELLKQLEDKTEDLKDYKFPEGGYDISICSPAEKVLKKEKDGQEKKLDFEKIGNIDMVIKNSIQENLSEDKEGDRKKEIFIILNKIAKAAPILKNQEVSRLLSIIKSESISNFADRHKGAPKENITEAYNYLSEAKEILGVIFKDNFKNSLKDFLEKNPENAERIKKVLSEGRWSFIKALGKNFKDGNIAKDEYWDQLNFDKLAELLSIFTDEKIIGNLRKDASKELNKITDKGAEDQKTSRKQEENINLKAYISKNIGSFFAKASAGICTAGDIELFNRPDHFHINLAKGSADGNELIKGNIQAYVIDDNGGKSLLLRGINPNSDFLYAVDIKVLCDKIIEVGKKFKEDNNLKEVYLCEPLEGWHALSNRDQVVKYLSDKYLKQEKEKSIDFNITSGQKISKMYKV